MSVSRSYNYLTYFTDSIFRTGGVTYLMRSGAVAVIVIYSLLIVIQTTEGRKNLGNIKVNVYVNAFEILRFALNDN